MRAPILLGLVASGHAGTNDCNVNSHCSSGEFCYSSNIGNSGNEFCGPGSLRNCDCHACDDYLYGGGPGFASGTQNCARYENVCKDDCTQTWPAPTRKPVVWEFETGVGDPDGVDCLSPETEEECRDAVRAAGLSKGGDSSAFAGDYGAGRGCYTYAYGAYAGMGFWSTSGDPTDMAISTEPWPAADGGLMRVCAPRGNPYLLYKGGSCNAPLQIENLGAFDDPEGCAPAAHAAGCPFFMWSPVTSWGCRCCSGANWENPNWNFYALDASAPLDFTPKPIAYPTPRPTPTPSLRPTPRPTQRPTPTPSARPTPRPTARLSPAPTPGPGKPTASPSPAPSPRPTPRPTSRPTGGAPTTFECVNDDSTADSAGDTCTDWYDDHPEDCRGQYDDEDFYATDQCCACEGYSYAYEGPPVGSYGYDVPYDVQSRCLDAAGAQFRCFFDALPNDFFEKAMAHSFSYEFEHPDLTDDAWGADFEPAALRDDVETCADVEADPGFLEACAWGPDLYRTACRAELENTTSCHYEEQAWARGLKDCRPRCPAAPTPAPTLPPVVAGSLTLAGVSIADVTSDARVVLREAIAAVAAVDADAVTIVRVGSARRRRLQADVDGIVVEYKIETTSFAEAEAIEAGVLGADDVAACLDDASTTGLYDFGCSQISTPAWCSTVWKSNGASGARERAVKVRFPHRCSMLDDADFTASEQCCACGGGNSPNALMAQGLADAAAGTSSEDLFFGVAVEAMGVEIVSTFAPTASPTTFWDNKQSSSNEKFEAILQGERGMGLQLVVLMALIVAALVGGCCCYFSAKALSGLLQVTNAGPKKKKETRQALLPRRAPGYELTGSPGPGLAGHKRTFSVRLPADAREYQEVKCSTPTGAPVVFQAPAGASPGQTVYVPWDPPGEATVKSVAKPPRYRSELAPPPPPSPPCVEINQRVGEFSFLRRPPAAEPASTEMVVTIPPGTAPGSQLTLSLPDGREQLITTPPGSKPGDSLSVPVPPAITESAPPAALGCGLMDLDCGLDTTDAPADLEDGPIPYN